MSSRSSKSKRSTRVEVNEEMADMGIEHDLFGSIEDNDDVPSSPKPMKRKTKQPSTPKDDDDDEAPKTSRKKRKEIEEPIPEEKEEEKEEPVDSPAMEDEPAADADEQEERKSEAAEEEEEHTSKKPRVEAAAPVSSDMMKMMMETIQRLEKQVSSLTAAKPGSAAALPPAAAGLAQDPVEVVLRPESPTRENSKARTLITREEAPALFKEHIKKACGLLESKLEERSLEIAGEGKKKLKRAGLSEIVKSKITAEIDLAIDAASEETAKAIENLKLSLADEPSLERFYLEHNDWAHPDTMMKAWCRRTNNGLWWEDQKLNHWNVTVKKSAAANYLSLKNQKRPQKFNGSQLKQASFITPMVCINYARVFPHGDKDSLGQFAPTHPTEIKRGFSISPSNFSDAFDPNYPDNNPTNVSRFFDWIKTDFHSWLARELLDTEGAASAVKTKARASYSPAEKDDIVKQRVAWASSFVTNPVKVGAAGASILANIPLFENLQVWHGEAGSGYKGLTKYIQEKMSHPVLDKPDKDKKPRTTSTPLIENPLPCFAMRTHAEYTALRAAKPDGPPVDPFYLIDPAQSMIDSGDEVFALVSPHVYDADVGAKHTGCGSLELQAVFFVGGTYSLDESVRSLPAGVDISQFCVMANPYTRTGSEQQLSHINAPTVPMPVVPDMRKKKPAGGNKAE